MTNPAASAMLFGLLVSEHHVAGKSLREIERNHTLANGTLSSFARRHSLRVRTKKEQARLDFDSGRRVAPVGEKHFAWGQTKETNANCAAHSRRMTANNPAKRPEVIAKAMETKERTGFNAHMSAVMMGRVVTEEHREKIAKTISTHLLETMSHREQMMLDALIAFDRRWISQYHSGAAVLDFAIPDIRIAFEIDVGSHKLNRSADRDLRAVANGWTILRFRVDNAVTADYFGHAFRIGEKIIPDFKCPDEYPRPIRKPYRVVVRCPEYPTGLSVNYANDAAFVALCTSRGHV